MAESWVGRAKTCAICGEEWMPRNRYQAARNKTCSKICAAEAIRRARQGKPTGRRVARVKVNCAACGKEMERLPSRLRRVRQPTCSCRCNGKLRGAEWGKHGRKGRAGWTAESRASYKAKMSGPNNPAWKGGVTLKRPKGNYRGVRHVRAPQWALPMARQDGYIAEHRLVMAERMGRRMLARTEVVHHLDHDPSNNAPENLELWPTNRSHKAAEHGRIVEGVANRVFPPVLGLLLSLPSSQ